MKFPEGKAGGRAGAHPARLALGLTLCLIGSGCAAALSPTARFVQSSLAGHDGKPHEVALADHELDAVVGWLIALGKERELVLVKQEACDATSCTLAFRSAPVDRRVFHGTASLTLSYYSRYFVTLHRQGHQLLLAAIGVPVLGGQMACPETLKRWRACQAPELRRPPGQELVDAVRAEWGYDISGLNEAETLQGLLTELSREAARQAQRRPDPRPRRKTSAAENQPAADAPQPVGEAAAGSVAGASERQAPGSLESANLAQRTAYLALRAQGKACYRRRDYDCALQRFASALAQVANPAMRFNLASAQDKLGLAVLAVGNYQRYLREAGGSAPSTALRHISARLAVIGPSVAQIELTVLPAGASVLLDGAAPADPLVRQLGEGDVWSLVLTPGTHQIQLVHQGSPGQPQTLQLRAGERRRLTLRAGSGR